MIDESSGRQSNVWKSYTPIDPIRIRLRNYGGGGDYGIALQFDRQITYGVSDRRVGQATRCGKRRPQKSGNKW